MLLPLRLLLPIRVLHHTATATVRILLVDTTNSGHADDVRPLPALSFVSQSLRFSLFPQFLTSSFLPRAIRCFSLTFGHPRSHAWHRRLKERRQTAPNTWIDTPSGWCLLPLPRSTCLTIHRSPPLLILLPVRVCTPFSSATAAATVQILLVANGMTHFLCLCNPSQTDECR